MDSYQMQQIKCFRYPSLLNICEGYYFFKIRPREASEMFQNTNFLRPPCFRGFWVHSLKTSDKVLRYGENNQVEFSEHPTVVQRGNERTINIYAAKTLDASQGIIHHREGIDLLPSNIELSGFEVRLINAMSRERVLKTYVNEVKKNYDYVLIDCMPSLRIRLSTLNSSALTGFSLMRAIFTRICTSTPRCGMWAVSPRPKPRNQATSL